MIRRSAAPWLPALLGLLALLATGTGLLPAPILYLRADAGALAALAGCAVSAAMLGARSLRARRARALRQALAAQQAQAADERRQFLQRLDHELKNPLTALHAGLANLAADPGSEQAEISAGLSAQARRLGQLAGDLRKLASLEVAQLELSPVDIAGLLDEAMTAARDHPCAGERTLALVLPQVPWPPPPVTGDRDLLFLAIYNLLDNALKFTAPGARIELRAFETGAGLTIEVADTGPGIPAAEQPHVWQELYRGQDARVVPGSGLGLTLVRAIVERHQGQVQLRSRPAQGTVVAITLPVWEGAPAHVSER